MVHLDLNSILRRILSALSGIVGILGQNPEKEREIRLDKVKSYLEKARGELNIDGEVVTIGDYAILETESFIICVNMKNTHLSEDPFMVCFIATGDESIFHVAHKMMLLAAAAANVRLQISDDLAIVIEEGDDAGEIMQYFRSCQ